VRPVQDLLVMTLLSYEHHFRDPAPYEARLRAVRAPAKELHLAEELVASMSVEDFDFSVYRDQYVDKLRQLVEARIRGRGQREVPDEEELPATLSFMDALRRSLEAKAPGAGTSRTDLETAGPRTRAARQARAAGG